MKFNFRKIASVLSSAVMVSSTIALAAAATYPAPFVQNGVPSVAIVIGSNPIVATTDAAAAASLQTDLQAKLTAQAGSSSGGTSTVTGESLTLEKGSNLFNMGNDLEDFYTTIDVDTDGGKLANVLKDGEYKTDVDDYKYTQEIALGDDAVLGFYQDDNFNDEKPFLGFDLASGNHILNYTLEFETAVEGGAAWVNLVDTEINILGKPYYIAEVSNKTSGPAITLLDTSNSQTVNEGDSITVTAPNGKSYNVKLDLVDEGPTAEPSAGEATFIVDDVELDNTLETGDVEEIEEGVYLSAKKVKWTDSDRKTSYATFSIGTGKLYLEDDEEVELNDKAISSNDKYKQNTLTASMEVSGEELNAITLSWDVADDAWIAPGTDLVMPALESVKLSMTGFEQADFEETLLKGTSSKYYVSTDIKDGSITLYMLYGDESTISGTGERATHKLVTNYTWNASGSYNYPAVTLLESENSYFVATWYSGDEGYSKAFEIGSIDDSTGDTVVELDNLVSEGADVTFSDVGDIKNIGDIDLKLMSASDTTGKAVVLISPASAGSGTTYSDRLITKKGLMIELPQNTNASARNNWTSAVFKNWLVEADKDGDIAAGNKTSVRTAPGTEGFEPDSPSGGIGSEGMIDSEPDSETSLNYMVSDIATKLVLKNPDSGLATLTVYYPGEESKATVLLAESGAIITEGPTTQLGDVIVQDTELSTVTGKNLIVVGGACVNTYAATLLSSATPLCGPNWESRTGVGAGKFLIQTFALTDNKIATLVAGYEAGDTVDAVTKLKTDTTLQLVDKKKYTGTLQSVTESVVS